MRPPQPGDLGEDVVTPPRPLTEQPPVDRFCDVVLTGGVASGVVYPWAVLELARHYRFRQIGGTSVGAMAAALAAAAEYGRRCGHPQAFEVLRRVPGRLAQEVDDQGTTRLLSLFQPLPAGRRLFDWFVRAMRRRGEPERARTHWASFWSALDLLRIWAQRPLAIAAVAVVGLAAALCWGLTPAWQQAAGAWPRTGLALTGGGAWLGALVGALALVALCAGRQVWRDLRAGLIANGLGLCRGGPSGDPARPALVEWLHDGIQRAAGLAPADLPLRFRDLWNAPLHPGGLATPVDASSPAAQRAIDLQVIVANVTLGRPFRLPLHEPSNRLFFDPEELRAYFPDAVMAALLAHADPYRPLSPADPPASAETARFRELPGADLPVVVAARMSLSFPLLFSAVPLYAIDYEHPVRAQRRIERCWCSDGGLCSNFPIHLFDAAIPRWPTFGLWLGKRGAHRPGQAFWLPEQPGSGRGEIRQRFDPADSGVPGPVGPLDFVLGFLGSLLLTAKDWGDFTRMRMPHVRNRVARLLLRQGEGGLNIGMSRTTMLQMADTYGTAVGKRFVQQFGTQPDGQPGLQWREQRWVRLQILIESLRELVQDLRGAAAASAYSLPLEELIQAARDVAERPSDRPVDAQQAADIARVLKAIFALESSLADEAGLRLYASDPSTELRVRPAL